MCEHFARKRDFLRKISDMNAAYIVLIWGDIERGERNVSIDNIAKIAKALGVTIDNLFS